MDISKRADQTVGFEVEIQNLQLCDGKKENKILLAESDKKINGKPAFYFVTDGAGGAPTVYIEVVSAPMKTVEDVRDYIKTVRQICSIGKKSLPMPLPDYFGSVVSMQYTPASSCYKITCPRPLINASNNHINLAVPFQTIGKSKFAETILFDNESKDVRSNISKQPFRAAQKYANNYKPMGASDAIVSLLTLFFYQQIVLLNSKIFIKPYTAENPCENLSKTRFPVLFKVCKADIIKTALSDEERVMLNNSAILAQIEKDLKSISTQVGTVRLPTDYIKNATKVLSVNATESAPLYDEPRLSGVIAPYKMAGVSDCYIVAEARTTKLNEQMKDMFLNMKDNTVQAFVKALQELFDRT